MISKIAKPFIIALLIFSMVGHNAAYALTPQYGIKAEAGLLMDMSTGEILYSKNGDEQLYPASLTKIMTAILVIEDLNLEDTVTIDDKSPFVDGSKMYLTPGEELTVNQLLNVMLVKSANDAALALAIFHSGSVEAFAEAMNAKAVELGATNTNFVNPNGLHDDAHVTTAHDLALMASYAMTLPVFRDIVKKSKLTVAPTNKQPEVRVYSNSNKLLWAEGSKYKMDYKGKQVDIKYDIVNGIKTGYTTKADQCIVTSAADGDKEMLAVILKTDANSIYSDARTLLDFGLYEIESETLITAGDFVVSYDLNNEKNNHVDLVAKNTVKSYKVKGETLTGAEQNLVMNDGIELPIKEGEVLATLEFFNGEEIIGTTELVAASGVSDKDMFLEETHFFADENKNSLPIKIGKIVLKFIAAFFIWRFIMTFINLKKRQRKSKI
ncbi:MAG: D-alanyl-D-alanine carboxypeptidase [Clostridia bacterium]|nr:D-alanyl-D-alanine carboxypeptidase [Clostridia bacterium]